MGYLVGFRDRADRTYRRVTTITSIHAVDF